MYIYINLCNGRGRRLYIYIDIFKTGSLDNAIQDLPPAQPSWHMSQYTIIPKYGRCICQLKFKKIKLKNFPSKNNRGSINKATNYGMKIFQGKNLTTLF